MSELVLMRVKAGKRALPYNDGVDIGEHQPGEPFRGPRKYLVDFRDHVEEIDDAGNVVNDGRMTATPAAIMTARAHEKVSMLADFRQAREKAHVEELADIDRQIEQARVDAEKEAEAKRKQRAAHVEHPDVVNAVASTTQPASTVDASVATAAPVITTHGADDPPKPKK